MTGARNGLSVDALGYIVMGQDVAAAGDPGKLLNIREIPMNGFSINYPTKADSWMHITSGDTALQFFPGDPAVSLQQPIEILTLQGANPGPTDPYGNFQIGWIEQSFINPDGQRDAVMSSGYNTNGGDGKRNINEAAFATVLESHFQQGTPFAATFEWYITTDAKNNDINRHQFLIVDKTDGSSVMDWTIDQFNIKHCVAQGSALFFSLDGAGSLQNIGPNAQFSMTTPTVNTDGGIVIQCVVGSLGTTRFSNQATGAGARFDFASAVSMESPAGIMINGFTNFWTQSNNVVGATRGWTFLNLNVDAGRGMVTCWNNGNFSVYSNSYFGVEFGGATAHVHCAPSPAGAAGTGPLKIDGSGPLLTTPEDGLFEYSAGVLYFTVGATRKTVTLI